VFETLKANSRNGAQVILFKDAERIFGGRVDNFVRKWPDIAPVSGTDVGALCKQRQTGQKSALIFNKL
jgi:hypothetical protein